MVAGVGSSRGFQRGGQFRQMGPLGPSALLYVSHITVRDKVRVVKVVRGNSSKRVKGIEICRSATRARAVRRRG